MSDAPRERPRVDVERPRCPYCHEGVGADDAKAACEGCMAWHHRACWEEHRACAACGRDATATPAGAAARPPSGCRRPGCGADAEPGRPICGRHAEQDAKVALVAGLAMTLTGAVIRVTLDGLAGVGAAWVVMGAVCLGLAAKSAADRLWTARGAAARERPAPPKAPDGA